MALNPPLRDWRGKTAWIVGASSGIGLATAQALAAQGARVALSARDAALLQQHANALPRGLGLALPLDVTEPTSVRAAMARLQGQWGTPDFVLACAGHYKAMRATEFDLPELRRHVEVNYMGALNVLEAALPALLAAGKGHISLVGSVAAYRGLPQALAYGPTKAALNNLAEVLYLDLQPKGLGVSIINPGFVRTPLTSNNQFHMPALITPEQAAQAMLQGWATGHFEINFPRRFSWSMKALRYVSDGLYFAAVRKATGL
jgi:NAD(P)-dependent dehydrogenase (short-subunit alcohol dehydrogenase family)